ncbi:hypothetical protein PISS_a2690 [Pseudoalteromonas issachenkonii]|uniref:Uncharacterized protein n=1 Tax=Pseudoalteromonas issachenkonii TaxID=152297 RepID=A0ABN5CA50_9GAMM|nr:hypothetical protein PISS_a2690 [Pseudoalteromonas issachenkonii]
MKTIFADLGFINNQWLVINGSFLSLVFSAIINNNAINCPLT